MKKDVTLGIDQAAALLRIPRSKVQRWVQQGQIPCKIKGKRCYFKKKEILDWAKSHDLMVFDTGTDSGRPDEDSINLKAGIERGGVFFKLEGNDAASVLKNAVEVIPFPPHVDRENVLEALISREEIASTGIGKGVAIPHPRHPISIKKFMIPVFFLQKDIDFHSVDGKPISVLFFLFSPSTQVHLKLLSKLSFCLRETDFLASLKNCRNVKSVLKLIEEHESQLERNKTS